MEEQLRKLESLVNSKLEDWTEETLLTIVQNEEIIKEFTPELAIYIIDLYENDQVKNDKIIDVLMPVKYAYYLREAQEQLDEYLEKASKKEITREEFEDLVNPLTKSAEPITRTAAYLTLLMVLDTDMRDNKDNITSSISDIIDIINSLNIDNAFEVESELVDLITAVIESYSQKYQEDILIRKEDFELILKALDEKIEEIQAYLAEMGYSEDELEAEQEHIHDENCGHTH